MTITGETTEKVNKLKVQLNSTDVKRKSINRAIVCIGTREDKLYPLLIGMRELNMKLYAVVSLEKYRANGN